MSICRCIEFRGEPDTDAERVAAMVAQVIDQWTASLRLWAPHLLPGRVSVSERLRTRLRAEGAS